jgi:chitodextrinase
VLRLNRKVLIDAPPISGPLRAARSLQAAVIVAVTLLPLTSLVAPADARWRYWDRYAPTAPTNLTATAATAGDSVVRLTWLVSTDTVGVTGYRIYRGGARVASVSGSTWNYSDTAVVNGTTYSYTVKAVDAAGNVSAASNTATATPQPAADVSSPSAPGNLTATGGNSSVGLKWSAATDNVGVTGYRVYRAGAQIASLAASTLSYSDPGLTNGTSYSYTVKAVDAASNPSAASNTATATPNAPQPSGCALQLHCWSFETGNYSQYDQHEWSEGPWADQSTYTINNVGHSECDILTSPVHEGSYASRCHVKPTTGTSTSDRAEMVTSNADATGDASQIQFYGWWTMFPSVDGGPQDWWHQGGDWNDFFQFGQYPNGLSGATWPYCGVDATSSPARLYCEGPGIPYCSACGRNKVYLGNLVYDHWYHFVVEARWSSDSSVGYLSIWVDGVNVSPKTYGATLTGTATQVHVSWGMYRGAYSSTNTVIHDGLCRAATYQGAVGAGGELTPLVSLGPPA